MADVHAVPAPRLGSGIPGLDVVLGGGWPTGGSYLIQGSAGVGKTTTGLHFLRAGVEAGERAAIVCLSESEDELRKNALTRGWTLEGIDIIDLSRTQRFATPGADYSVFSPDEVELNEVIDQIRDAIEAVSPDRLVLDPISGIRMLCGSASRYRQQSLALKDFLLEHQITALILSDAAQDEMDAYLETAVQGVLWIRQELGEYGDTQRFMGLKKVRGASYQSGEHPFRIDVGGITVFPRIEAPTSPGGRPADVLKSGIPELDRLLGGGIPHGTATVISGQSGVGKTTLALQFVVEAARRGERARVFSLDESASSMLQRIQSLGLDASPLVDSGALKIEKVRSTEIYPAEFARIIQNAVEHEGVQVVLIDSLTAYKAGVAGEAHLVHHLSQLLDFLAGERVTTFLTLESADHISLAVSDSLGVSYLSDNAILLRFFEAGGSVRRAINVLKKRGGSHESTIRELQFADGGIRIGPPLTEFRGVLGGTPEYMGEKQALFAKEDPPT